jgi:hypothetical protein
LDKNEQLFSINNRKIQKVVETIGYMEIVS